MIESIVCLEVDRGARMKSTLAIVLASAILLIAALFLASPPQQVSAETCRDARGNVIPCPEKRKTKTPLPPPPSSTPTATPTATPTKPLSAFGFGGISPIPTDKRPPKIDTPWGDLPTFGGVLGPLLLGGLLLLLLLVGLMINKGMPITVFQIWKGTRDSEDMEATGLDDLGGGVTSPLAELAEGSKLQPPPEQPGSIYGLAEPTGLSVEEIPPRADLGGPDTGPHQQPDEDPNLQDSPDPERGDRDA
jgi:hypothetical protein